MPVMVKVSASQQNRCNFLKWGIIFLISIFCVLVLRELFPSSYPTEQISSEHSLGQFTSFRGNNGKILRATTWNVAAINNNPFEYWITSDSSSYENLMKQVANFINDPADKDVPVSNVFTSTMFDELYNELVQKQIPGYDETKEIWERDFKNRKIISQFIKDGTLGKKRLISMPDRVTNTINAINPKNIEEKEEIVVMRPTVVNCYQEKLNTMNDWWKHWKHFMFNSEIAIKKKTTSGDAIQKLGIYQIIPKIEKAKYPSITSEEEKISVPLSILSLAIFDSILVHMMNTLAADSWQQLRSQICTQCNFQKNQQILNILINSYNDSNFIFLQEVAGSFFTSFQQQIAHKKGNVDDLQRYNSFLSSYHIVFSSLMDYDRDQNSFILLKKDQFHEIKEVTEGVLKILDSQYAEKGGKNPVVNGDLLAITAIDKRDNVKYLFASFHGDTNGLATKPVVDAVHTYAVNREPKSKLVFGLDANTYTKPESDQEGVEDFVSFYLSKNLNSCWGPKPNPTNFTTFHARTHLQAQLNKAVTYEERYEKGDRNLKDFIVFFNADFDVIRTIKDNTGKRFYKENMVFPTLTFPSDHGITSTLLLEKLPQ